MSLTLPTEAGTVYSLEELRALRDVARDNNLLIHVDGARFGNAVTSLGGEPGAIIEASGADVLCFGGTKGGVGLSEAVVFFNRELAREFDYCCKQAGQLASKTRLLSAPWATMLNGGHWLRYAKVANDMAQSLEKIFRTHGLEALYPVEANAVFINLLPEVSTKLRERGWQFYSFFGGASRFMCSWNVSADVLKAFERDLKIALP
ncbi:low specificity L-threonine aldolase [Abditibacteriota bacterium]|nr:low specificity L-threonine aldolase [Abditibacteriota bacterium]